MSNIAPMDWIFHYRLSKKITLLNQVQNSSNIEFEIFEEKILKKISKYIIGFKITVRDSLLEQAEEQSKTIARNLKNIITIKSGIPIEADLKDYHSIPKKGETGKIANTFEFLYNIKGGIIDLDLTNSNIQSIINSNENYSLNYQYLSKGIFHYYNGNPADSIREAFKIVEEKNLSDNSLPNYHKYKVLRNMFSHPPPYDNSTINKFLNEFNDTSFDYNIFDCKRKIILINLESNKNIRLLNKFASELISVLRKELKLEI